jgi:hypothetical protein
MAADDMREARSPYVTGSIHHTVAPDILPTGPLNSPIYVATTVVSEPAAIKVGRYWRPDYGVALITPPSRQGVKDGLIRAGGAFLNLGESLHLREVAEAVLTVHFQL